MQQAVAEVTTVATSVTEKVPGPLGPVATQTVTTLSNSVSGLLGGGGGHQASAQALTGTLVP